MIPFGLLIALLGGVCFSLGCWVGELHAKAEANNHDHWIDVKNCLPPVEQEVIVLSDNIHGKTVKGACYISYGHRVDTRYAKDYDGWNIPGVHHWIPCPPVPGEDSARYSSNLCF